MYGEWKAPLTSNRLAFFAPRAAAFAQIQSRTSMSPDSVRPPGKR